MAESPARILVLGLGNDVLTDDAVGLHVAQAAGERLAGETSIETKMTTEMGLALLDEIADREGVVVVDSVQTGTAPPGHIHECGPEAFDRVVATVPHFLGVGETLALGRRLGLVMPRAVRIFAIEVADPFTLGTALTPAVDRAVSVAAERVTAAARALADIHNPPSSANKTTEGVIKNGLQE